MTKEQLLAEVDDLLRTMPARATIRHETADNLEWLGRASAILQAWNPIKSSLVSIYVSDFGSATAAVGINAFRSLLTLLYQAKHDLRMQTLGPVNVALGSGMVFDYFDQLRKVLELGKQDLFFIDPYLDASFISTYLPHVASGVPIRLLARERIQTLLPAVDMFVRQTGENVLVRSSLGFHDRYVIVDKNTCYQSGASFKDGARSAPTTLTQIADAFPAVLATYENLWNGGKIHR